MKNLEENKKTQKTMYEKRIEKIMREAEKVKMVSPLLAENIILREVAATYKFIVQLHKDMQQCLEKVISNREEIIEAYKRREKEELKRAA